MEVLTLPIRKTSTCHTLLSRPPPDDVRPPRRARTREESGSTSTRTGPCWSAVSSNQTGGVGVVGARACREERWRARSRTSRSATGPRPC